MKYFPACSVWRKKNCKNSTLYTISTLTKKAASHKSFQHFTQLSKSCQEDLLHIPDLFNAYLYIPDLFKMLVMIICRISGYIKTVKAFHTISKELPATSVYDVLYNFDFYPLRIICLTNLLIIFHHMDTLERL